MRYPFLLKGGGAIQKVIHNGKVSKSDIISECRFLKVQYTFLFCLLFDDMIDSLI